MVMALFKGLFPLFPINHEKKIFSDDKISIFTMYTLLPMYVNKFKFKNKNAEFCALI